MPFFLHVQVCNVHVQSHFFAFPKREMDKKECNVYKWVSLNNIPLIFFPPLPSPQKKRALQAEKVRKVEENSQNFFSGTESWHSWQPTSESGEFPTSLSDPRSNFHCTIFASFPPRTRTRRIISRRSSTENQARSQWFKLAPQTRGPNRSYECVRVHAQWYREQCIRKPERRLRVYTNDMRQSSEEKYRLHTNHYPNWSLCRFFLAKLTSNH